MLEPSAEREGGWVDATDDGVALLDARHRLLRANSRFASRLDVPPALTAKGADLFPLLEFLARHADLDGADPAAIGVWIENGDDPRRWRLASGRRIRIHAAREGERRWLIVRDETELAELRDRCEALRIRLAEADRARERTERERRASEQQLHQAQKMETVGQLAGGLAHDFNNLLTVILGSLEFMQDQLDREHPCRRLIAEAERAATRGADLTHRMLAFSRIQALQPRVVELGAAVEALEGLIRRTIGESIAVEVRVPSEPTPTKIDLGQLENCLLNLCVNARDAMPDGGTLKLSVEKPSSGRMPEGWPVEGRWLVRVEDDGSGMPEEVLGRAIDPFFTTKEVNRGSGLGLSMVYGFVKQSGGHFKIESEPGRGTTVLFSVPAWSGARTVPVPPESRPTEVLPGRRILLTEDSPEVRAVVSAMLTRMGHEVLEADSHADALETLSRPGGVDLLFTDIVLPGGKNGFQLAAEALRADPALKVLFMSGYQRRKTYREGPLERYPMLKKPFQTDELARALREAIVGREVEPGAESSA